MNRVAKLSKNEQISFMKVLYSLFYMDDKIESWEKSVLVNLCKTFGLKSQDESLYVAKLFSNMELVAGEINKIKDLKTRQYLFRIIEEGTDKANKSWFSKNVAATADPAVTKSRLENVQDRAKQTRFSQRSWKLLTEAIQDACAIGKANMGRLMREKRLDNLSEAYDRRGKRIQQALQFISRLQDEISDLESRIAKSSNSGYIQKAQGRIREKQEKISEVKLQIQGYESERSDIARQIQEIRNKIH